MQVTKAKISRGKFVEVHVEKPGVTKPREAGEMIFDPPHPDQLNAWDALAIHFAIMTGYVAAKDVDITDVDPELIKNFTVSAFSIGGEEQGGGVVLTGQHRLADGPITINTRFTRFEQKEDTRYKFMDDLIEKLEVLKTEMLAFYNSTKVGKDPQGNLFEQPAAEEKKITKIQIAPEETLLNGGNGDILPTGGKKPTRTKAIPAADPEAMKRVAETPNEEMNGPVKQQTKGRKKRVAQSPDNRSGVIEDGATD